METNLPHLIVTEFGRESFTGTSGGNGKPRPVRDRIEHSGFLRSQLEQAWIDADNDVLVHQSHRNGAYLEFKGEQGFELITKSLESFRGTDSSTWTRLLNVRKEIVQTGIDSQSEEVVFATIYVPNSRKELLFKQIEKYANEENVKSGQPKNA